MKSNWYQLRIPYLHAVENKESIIIVMSSSLVGSYKKFDISVSVLNMAFS